MKLASRKAVGSATWCGMFLGTPYVDYIVNDHLVENVMVAHLNEAIQREGRRGKDGTESQGWWDLRIEESW